MSRLEKKLMKILEQTPIREYNLKNFMKKKMNSHIFSKKNKKEIIRLFPVLFSHTDYDNRIWLDLLDFFEDIPEFLDAYITNFPKIQYRGDTFLLQSVLSTMNHYKLTEEQTKLLIDKVLECNVTLDFYEVHFVYEIIEKNYPILKSIMLEKYIRNANTCDATIGIFELNQENIQILYNNIDFVLKNIKDIDLFYLLTLVNENQETSKKIKDFINRNPKEKIEILINKLYRKFCNYNSLEKEEQDKLKTIIELIYLIIEDVCKNENINISDIQFLGGGTFSTVLEVGEKVIKIGNKRGTPVFPNNPYVNAILLRKEFPINEKESFFVEVNEKLDTKSKIEVEELYQLYKKIRDIGLIWSDVDKRNVGRLKKENTIHWREQLPITDERLGLEKYRGTEILKKGDIVVLDNDLIFEENTPLETINNWKSLYRNKFEERYQQEKSFTYSKENQQNNIFVNVDKDNMEIKPQVKRSK